MVDLHLNAFTTTAHQYAFVFQWFDQLQNAAHVVDISLAHGADIVTSGVLDFGPDKEGRARFGHFDISFERSRKSEYEIIGTKGWVKCHAAWVFQNDVPVISWALEDGKYAEERFAPSNHFNLEIEHFSDCVLNDKAPNLTFDDAKANCKAIEMVLRATNAKPVIA